VPDHRRAVGRALSSFQVGWVFGVVLVGWMAGGCSRQDGTSPIEIGVVQGSFAPLAGVVTQHNDLARTGANLNETILNTSNVNTSQFGKLTSLTVSGQVYSQPLYVTSAINGKNVVFIATEANTVYAYNADSPWDLIWSRTDFEPPWSSTACANTQPLIGISSTPVIDTSTGTIYVVNKTNSGTTYKILLHLLDMTTGADKVPPVDVSKAADGTTVSVSGTGDGSVSGKLTFDPMRHQNRVGLTLSNGVLSIGFASHCDQNNYHGWLLRFDTTVSPPHPLAPYVTTPNTGHGGFWMGGEGFSVDSNGDLYFMSGDGRSGDTTTNGTALANAFVRLTNVGVSGTPTVGTWFMPSDVASLDTADADIGSSGPLLIPGTSLLIGGGKNGIFYVLNRTNMGGFVSGSPPEPQIVQRFSPSSNNGQIVGSPVWWESPAGPRLYVWPGKAPLAAFSFDRTSNLFNTTAIAHGVDNPTTDPQGGQMSLSANGSTAGTGILWATHPLASTGGGGAVAGVLYAYNAENIAQKLWDSSMKSGDAMASATKYVPPTVANGKVYVGTFSNKVEVYGLLQPPPVDAGAGGAGGTGGSAGAGGTGGSATDGGTTDAAQGMITCTNVDGGAAQPTNWTYVFNTYFAGTAVGTTAGHCQECHTTTEGGFTCGADKDSCYAGLVASGKITPDAGTSSPIGDPNQSMLAWFNNPVNPPGVLAFMPSDQAVANSRAVAAVCGWVAAGARDDKSDGTACAGAYECANGGCCGGVCDNPATDFNNCGSCGNACLAGSSCSSGACTVGCSGTNALIDNFDDGNAIVSLLEDRNGHIYTVADSLGSTVSPAVGTFTTSSPGHSGLGAHITGHVANSNSSPYAGVNLDFTYPRATYNASRYLGFTFYAKKGSGSANSALRVNVPDHNTDAAGGVCTSCGFDFGTGVTLSTSWTKYTVLFASLTQQTGGSPRPLAIDATQLYGIKFLAESKNANYDFWIDDVTFICN
jgi:Carbohydrate binding domain (family 11)